MEELLSEAKAKGMHVVEEGNIQASYADYERLVKEADALCEVKDPEETPFNSKYEARAKLDALCNRMEANRTIASLEKNKEMIHELDWRINATRVRLASIAWEVEEPHNAQTELELAAEYYAPGVVPTINEMSGEADSSSPPNLRENMDPPVFRVENGEICGDVMKCINLLGILWAGRDHAKRSFLYLLCAKQFYDNSKDQDMSSGVRDSLEASLTHNLFYLAQAYGNIGNAELSSLYCHMTLQRQLNDGLDVSSGLEWGKNCMGMADFHIALSDFDRAAHCLGATDVVMTDLFGVAADTEDTGEEKTTLSVDDREKLSEIRVCLIAIHKNDPLFNNSLYYIAASCVQKADLNRRWITLDTAVLKWAYERKFSEGYDLEGDGEGKGADSSVGRFHGIEVESVPFMGKNDIKSFEDARTVFLRCTARLETAKKTFPLDGFVTDHVHLVRQHSLLYHYLAGFELDVKRKLAMELRRSEMLKKFPTSLSRTAFEGLVKGICHELGEIYMNMFDLKLQKVSQKNPKILEAPDKLMKLADLNKCNEYCLNAIAMFLDFTSFYSKKSENDAQMASVFAKDSGSTAIDHSALSIDDIMKLPIVKPAHDMLAEEEVRPYLNAHFFTCRLLSKYIPLPGSSPGDRTKYTVASLHRYQWLVANAAEICEKKETTVDAQFGEELEVCREMVQLLPPKIDRMHYYGEGGM